VSEYSLSSPLAGSHLTGNIPDVCNLLAYQYGRQADASDLLSQTDSLNEFEGLGINVNLSKHPEMAVVSRRLATFLTYPYKSAKHPEQLVEGGYFYSGISSVSSLKCVLSLESRLGLLLFWYDCLKDFVMLVTSKILLPLKRCMLYMSDHATVYLVDRYVIISSWANFRNFLLDSTHQLD